MKHDQLIPELSALLTYQPLSGSLRWSQAISPRAKEGSEAGYTRPDGHRIITFKGCAVPVAKICWYMVTGQISPYVTHINSDKSDFRFVNLTPSDTRPRSLNSNSTTGLKGVFYDKKRCLYRACVSIKGKRYSFGYHQTAELANKALQDGLRELNRL